MKNNEWEWVIYIIDHRARDKNGSINKNRWEEVITNRKIRLGLFIDFSLYSN